MNILPFERSYWVIPNKLIAGEIPSANNENESEIKLTGLINIHINVVINLMERNERNHHGDLFYDYSIFLKKNDIKTFKFPVKDLSIPDIEKMKAILNLIDQSHKQHKIVYVHCWGGLGRTGTVVGCYLMRHGFATKENVFDIISYLKRTTSISGRMSPETNQQKEFVLNWKQNQ
jgi:protein-tyrosine phosphatase